jgi:hypothetical protein
MNKRSVLDLFIVQLGIVCISFIFLKLYILKNSNQMHNIIVFLQSNSIYRIVYNLQYTAINIFTNCIDKSVYNIL